MCCTQTDENNSSRVWLLLILITFLWTYRLCYIESARTKWLYLCLLYLLNMIRKRKCIFTRILLFCKIVGILLRKDKDKNAHERLSNISLRYTDMNAGAPEVSTDPVRHVTPIVLLLNTTHIIWYRNRGGHQYT